MSRPIAGVGAFAVALAVAGPMAWGQEAADDLSFGAETVSEAVALDGIRGGSSIAIDELMLEGAVNVSEQHVTNTVTGSTVIAGGDLNASGGALSHNMMTVNMFNSGVNAVLGAQVSMHVTIVEAPTAP